MALRKGETRAEYRERMRGYFQEYHRKNRDNPEYKATKRGIHFERFRTDPEYRERCRSRTRNKYFGREDAAAMRPGTCDLCGEEHDGTKGPRDLLFQDHCHETGALRGMLCTRCNNGLGMLGDNVEGLRRALAYLERHQ